MSKSSGHMSAGQPSKDLTPVLGGMLWDGQQLPPNHKLLVSSKRQYYWVLPCHKHLRLMTCQAAMKQLQLPNSNGTLVQCERCGVGNYWMHGAQPVPGDVHRSYWETLAWLGVEKCLDSDVIMQYIASKASAPLTALVGRHLGYVVEGRVLPGWPGCVDVYVPALQLILQIDGEHHDSDAHGQQSKDIRFLQVASKHGFHALRLSHVDYKTFHQDIAAMLHDCMHACGAVVSRISRGHPLRQNTDYQNM